VSSKALVLCSAAPSYTLYMSLTAGRVFKRKKLAEFSNANNTSNTDYLAPAVE
jgi:hypothetical protein